MVHKCIKSYHLIPLIKHKVIYQISNNDLLSSVQILYSYHHYPSLVQTSLGLEDVSEHLIVHTPQQNVVQYNLCRY